ncbi:PBECR2 nuclease fold domain-containing protein [Pseudomonas putida]|uniref:PBECR2 nuclease fold domain-containing protein n=1 Tax=Pseudomonas putida TaxID=303 RepID=UPI002119B652|nr:PBECR2 nuclease fold domain-containing protein [Pseudomonas putida]
MSTATPALSTAAPAPRISEEKGQPTWVDAGLQDLRTLEREYRSPAIDEIPHAASHEEAIEAVASYLGFKDASEISLSVDTPLGMVLIRRDSIYHIVEKRQDARERYVGLAMNTLTNPYEVWKVAFTNNTHRLAYIGVYESKRQMLVSVTMENGRMLWNFMHCDAKALNRHRHGELLYRRHPEALVPGKEKAA